MPTTYTIISNFSEIGKCDGLPVTDVKQPFILFPPEYLGILSVGDTLVSPDGQYLNLYSYDNVLENNELKALKFYYE